MCMDGQVHTHPVYVLGPEQGIRCPGFVALSPVPLGRASPWIGSSAGKQQAPVIRLFPWHRAYKCAWLHLAFYSLGFKLLSLCLFSKYSYPPSLPPTPVLEFGKYLSYPLLNQSKFGNRFKKKKKNRVSLSTRISVCTTTFAFTCSFPHLFIHVCMYLLTGKMHTCHNLYVNIRRQFIWLGFLLPLFGFWGIKYRLSLGHNCLYQPSYLTGPICISCVFYFQGK